MAYLLCLITNLAIRIHGKKGAKLLELSEFMPIWDKVGAIAPKQQSVEDMKSVLMALAAASKRKARMAKRPPPKSVRDKKDEK